MSQVFGTAREHCPIHQRLDLRGSDAAVREDLVDFGIDGDDAVEDAGVEISIELNENRFHVAWGAQMEKSPRAGDPWA